MSATKKNIILIGMPASGKSTVGVAAAKELGIRFLDSDTAIIAREGQPLQEIIKRVDNDGFLRIEEEVNLTLGNDDQPTIIATGGSAIYSDKAMEHFREVGTVVYLKLSFEAVRERLGDFSKRGVVVPKGYTLRDLYNERCAICERWAHLTLDEDQIGGPAAVSHELCRQVRAR